MRTALIESYLKQLQSSLGMMRRPVDETDLLALYRVRDFAGMIRIIQHALKLDLHIRLGMVKGGGPDAPAWIESPNPMPQYGTAQFRDTRATIYLRTSFVDEVEFEQTVCAIAHELSHLVLHAMYHQLRYEEPAVDLTAMLLGFRDFYVTGCELVREKGRSWLDRLSGTTTYVIHHQGYLTQEEVRFAAHVMTFGRPPSK